MAAGWGPLDPGYRYDMGVAALWSRSAVGLRGSWRGVLWWGPHRGGMSCHSTLLVTGSGWGYLGLFSLPLVAVFKKEQGSVGRVCLLACSRVRGEEMAFPRMTLCG